MPGRDAGVLRRQLALYLVTDRASMRGRTLEDVVAAAVAGGVTCVQLREKELASRDIVVQAIHLRRLLQPHGVPLVINDRVDVALACGADGVHLGQGDLPPDLARQRLPPGVFIGWSVETEADVRRAARLPVDYLAASPLFATPTKTDTAPAWGLEGLRGLRRMTALPLVAIGGIHPGNAADVLAAGADGLAVVRAVCGADDPRAAAQVLRAAMAGVAGLGPAAPAG